MNSIKDPSPLRNSLILALDVDSDHEALKLVQELNDIVGGFKLGPRLCLRYGQDLIRKISQLAPVFLDNKHFDIPSTMTSAVQASFDAGASLVTVHALAGFEALSYVAELEKELNKIRPFKVLCVSILTSWDQTSLPSSLKEISILEHVQQLSLMVKKAGLSGLVCSPHELEHINITDFYAVTPGIRLEADHHQDQKRTLTPVQAIKKGASALVVGRPILQSQDRRKTAEEILRSLH